MTENSKHQSAPASQVKVDLTQVNLNITGMTCANCALKINTKLESLPGISKATVVLPTESAVVVIDKNRVDIDTIMHAVTEIGYHATLSKVVMTTGSPLSTEKVNQLQSELKKLAGIENVSYQVEKNEIRVTFNSGEISEHQIMV
jgi:Cu+-exporting ATPase